MGLTTGFGVKGINHTLVRTGVGIYEVVTFPSAALPSGADGLLWRSKPLYPDSYKPRKLSDSHV